jgi:deoxyribodipyrimidine photo-lyase
MANKAIFLFQRSLRCYDNLGLIEALKTCDQVALVFIFDPVQIGIENIYRSDNSIQFMVESLQSLKKQIADEIGKSSLNFYYGDIPQVLIEIYEKYPFTHIFQCKDYTPYAQQRSRIITDTLPNVTLVNVNDITVQPIGSVLTGKNEIYKVFTPFYNKASTVPVLKPERISKTILKKIYKNKIKTSLSIHLKDATKFYTFNQDLLVNGGRENALAILKSIKDFKDYDKTRNFPIDQTTQLSAYNKYGCVSIREVYWAIREQIPRQKDLIKQLYWRDFYYGIAEAYPHVFKSAFLLSFHNFPWKKSVVNMEKWRIGMTGYPLVDAGMRQMNTIGWMHNRCRMVVASFLTKDLLISWKEGERYFANKLVDYDPSQNNGGWQWSAGTGTDAQPFVRIMNPTTQLKRFDPECEYVLEWIPELRDVPIKDILNWDKKYRDYPNTYVKPMVNHDDARKEALALFKDFQ